MAAEKTGAGRALKAPPAAANMRIGLLGGSFDPAHDGHRRISLAGLKRLGLDQVWWLVSPGNPLKAKPRTPSVAQRVEAAQEIAHHPKIVVTGFEAARRSVYTIDTVRYLKQRYPGVKFVWLIGADNLASLHRWRAWQDLFRLVPIAVFDRPDFRLKARAGRAAQAFARNLVDESDAPGLAGMEPPAWTFVTFPLSSLSSTALRRAAETDAASNSSEARQAKPRQPNASTKSPNSGKVARKARKHAGKSEQRAKKTARKTAKAAVKKLEKAARRAAPATSAAAKKSALAKSSSGASAEGGKARRAAKTAVKQSRKAVKRTSKAAKPRNKNSNKRSRRH